MSFHCVRALDSYLKKKLNYKKKNLVEESFKLIFEKKKINL